MFGCRPQLCHQKVVEKKGFWSAVLIRHCGTLSTASQNIQLYPLNFLLFFWFTLYLFPISSLPYFNLPVLALLLMFRCCNDKAFLILWIWKREFGLTVTSDLNRGKGDYSREISHKEDNHLCVRVCVCVCMRHHSPTAHPWYHYTVVKSLLFLKVPIKLLILQPSHLSATVA